MTSIVETLAAGREFALRLSARRQGYRADGLIICVEVAADAAALCAAYLAVVHWLSNAPFTPVLSSGAVVLAVLTGLLCLLTAGAYEGRTTLFDSLRLALLPALKGAAAMCFLAAMAFGLWAGFREWHQPAVFAAVTVVSIAAGRLALREVAARLRRAGLVKTRAVALAGSAQMARHLEEELTSDARAGVQVKGLILENGPSKDWQTRADEIARAAKQLRVDEVVFCHLRGKVEDVLILADRLTSDGIALRIISPSVARLARRMPVTFESWRGIPVVEFKASAPWRIQGWLKKILDYFISALALMILVPLWTAGAPFLAILQGWPVFFKQTRVKTNGQPFTFYKLRTMANGTPRHTEGTQLAALNIVKGPMFKVPDDPRVTGFGRWLRRFSIDETPQFVNVLKGDISVVGVRPPLPEEVAHYAAWHLPRLSGWTGITGLWQVSGRSELDFDEVVFLDLFYNRNFSISLDLRILWRTAGAVLCGTGAY